MPAYVSSPLPLSCPHRCSPSPDCLIGRHHQQTETPQHALLAPEAALLSAAPITVIGARKPNPNSTRQCPNLKIHPPPNRPCSKLMVRIKSMSQVHQNPSVSIPIPPSLFYLATVDRTTRCPQCIFVPNHYYIELLRDLLELPSHHAPA